MMMFFKFPNIPVIVIDDETKPLLYSRGPRIPDVDMQKPRDKTK